MKQVKTRLSQIGSKPLTAKELANLGISRNELQRLLDADLVHRVGRAVYQVTSVDFSDEDQFCAAIKRIEGPSAVCLLSALSFHNLTDVIPKKVWLLVDASKKTTQKNIRLFRSHNPHWNVGIKNCADYQITTIERTLVDSLIFKHILGASTGALALRLALAKKLTTLKKIIEMAEALEFGQRLSPVLRVLL
jgi:predicted transcriptional regulator of viral defense system